MKRRILSGIQPTGPLHLGNYLGAVRQWAALQQEPQTECLYSIVDYHAITAEQDNATLAARSLELAADLLACGVGGEGRLFLQSQLPQHTELAWILSSVTAYGDLTRMTQFKEKSDSREFVSAALFTYPTLMAADILLYKATHVPVGEDQLQHLELSRSIARRFNQRFGETFPEPAPLTTRTPRVMSLADPSRKMSKSAGEKHVVGVFEAEDSIRQKIRSAVTATSAGEDIAPGVRNLLLLLEETDPRTATQLLAEQKEGTLKYVDLKDAVARALLAYLKPMRQRRAEIGPEQIRRELSLGAERAREIAQPTLEFAKEKIGLLLPRA